MRNCEGFGEEAVMEKVAEVGRKRKVGLGESQVSNSSVQIKTRRLDVVTPENSASSVNSGNSACESVSSDQNLVCSCSSNGFSELDKVNSKFVDLEEENVDFFVGDSLDCRERRETTPVSEVEAESGQLESTATPRKSNFRRRSMADNIPSESELEEFFAVAENNLQKQFTNKYNYDIVKDEPLEGRYEWVPIQLKP